MAKSFRRATARSIWLPLVVCALLQTSCTRQAPPEQAFSVGIADRATFDGTTLTLNNLRLISNGFLISKEPPPEDELKGKVFLQVLGLKRATNVSVELGTGLKVGGGPKDSPEAQALRERKVKLAAEEYDLTEYSAAGEPRDIPTIDIDLIIVDGN